MEIQNNNLQVQEPPKPATKEPRYKSYWQVMLIVLNLSLSNFYFGYCLVYISTVDFTTVMEVYNVPLGLQTARGILTGCISIGALFGALLGKKLIHWFSRRNFILFINVWAMISGALLYIQHMESFIIMRLIQGACIGLYTSIIPICIAEISPVQISGATGAFTQIFCSVGTTIAYLFYYILSVALSAQQQHVIWYWVWGLPMVTLVIQTITLLFVFPYETPKYFLLHHQKSKARDLIAQIYKPEYVDIILHEKMQDVASGLAKQKAKKAGNQQVANTNPNPPTSNQNLPGGSQNFPPRMASVASVNSALSGVESPQPETAPMPIFTSLHLNTLRQLVGINAVVAYGGTIVKQAIPGLRAIAPTILNFETLLGACLSIYLLTKLGRKTILQGGTLILTFSLLLITVGFFIIDSSKDPGTALILIGLFIYMFVFGATLGTTIWLYIAEICEAGYIIYATAITWVFAAVVIILFPIIKNNLPNQNPCYLFLFFLIWTALSFIVNHKALIETKGKTSHQIQDEYKEMRLCGMGTVVKAAPEVEVKAKQDKHNETKQHNESKQGHHQLTSTAVIQVSEHRLPPIKRHEQIVN